MKLPVKQSTGRAMSMIEGEDEGEGEGEERVSTAKSGSNYCMATMGGVHEFNGDECVHCGFSRSCVVLSTLWCLH
jgi:hypothetical protein